MRHTEPMPNKNRSSEPSPPARQRRSLRSLGGIAPPVKNPHETKHSASDNSYDGCFARSFLLPQR